MIRPSAVRASAYLTVRTVSARSPAASWIRLAAKRNEQKQREEELQQELEDRIPEIIEQHLGRPEFEPFENG